jgi:hypothetical protein
MVIFLGRLFAAAQDNSRTVKSTLALPQILHRLPARMPFYQLHLLIFVGSIIGGLKTTKEIDKPVGRSRPWDERSRSPDPGEGMSSAVRNLEAGMAKSSYSKSPL